VEEDHQEVVQADLVLIVDQDMVIVEHTIVQNSVLVIPIQTA
jgi:hypothetical protein